MMPPSWSRALFLILLALPARAFAQAGEADRPPPGWPGCEDRQVEVVLLGTFHMAGHAEEIGTPHRQTEIRTLVDALARMEPTAVALEEGVRRQAELQAAYRAHVGEGQDLTANERQQIGFRLARTLNHDSVYAVDYPARIGNDSIGAFYARHPELQERYSWVLEAAEEIRAEFDRRLDGETVGSFLRWLNSEEYLAEEPNNVMYGHVMAGEGTNYGGPRMLEEWYRRNIRIAHHVSRLAEGEPGRILLLIGVGHVRPLRDLLRLAPQYCPVSPLPWIP